PGNILYADAGLTSARHLGSDFAVSRCVFICQRTMHSSRLQRYLDRSVRELGYITRIKDELEEHNIHECGQLVGNTFKRRGDLRFSVEIREKDTPDFAIGSGR